MYAENVKWCKITVLKWLWQCKIPRQNGFHWKKFWWVIFFKRQKTYHGVFICHNCTLISHYLPPFDGIQVPGFSQSFISRPRLLQVISSPSHLVGQNAGHSLPSNPGAPKIKYRYKLQLSIGICEAGKSKSSANPFV